MFVYRKYTLNFADCSAPLTNLCQKSLPGRVVHSDNTWAAFETLKTSLVSDLALSIPKSGQKAKFVVETYASKVALQFRVLLALLAQSSTLEILNIDDDFPSKLKGTFSSCSYSSNKKLERRSRQKFRTHPTECFDITIM